MTSSASSPQVSPARQGLLGAWLEGCNAAVTGGLDLLDANLARWPRPLDVPRWLSVASDRRPPQWATPHSIVFETPIARLRDFSVSPVPRGLVATLVLPPQAGHDSCIVDFSPEQSQMGAIREAGLRRAFTLDWVGAGPETADAGVDDYLSVIDRAVIHCGGRVNLIGDCQGGWLATIYAALNPERVNTLTIAGAPNRLPSRGADHRRRAQRAGAGRRPGLLRGAGPVRRRGAARQGHAVGLSVDRAPGRRSHVSSSCSPTSTIPGTSTAIGSSRIGSSTPRTSRGRSTCGSCAICSPATS